MTITDIVPKRKGMSALYIDGEFALKIDTETILISSFSAGDEITDEQLKELIDKSNEKRAKDRALRLISYRDHSKKELNDKVRRSCDADSAEKAVDRLEELGLVDDEKFARRYAHQLLQVKHLAPRAAKYKLAEKGIDRDLSQQVIDEIRFEPREHIRIIIESRYSNCLNDEKERRRAVAYLQRKGYDWSDINAVIDEFVEE